jgi:hypothetical protein
MHKHCVILSEICILHPVKPFIAGHLKNRENDKNP